MSKPGVPLTELQKAKMRAYSAILRQSPAYRARQSEHAKRYRTNPANAERVAVYLSSYGPKWRSANKPHLAAYHRNRRKTDPQFALAQSMRSRIGAVLRKGAGTKSASMAALVGCSMDALRAHLESQFQPGMNWEDRAAWHIDHKRPCASFDLTDPAQQRECFHWLNLQPLWKRDNLSKGARPL